MQRPIETLEKIGLAIMDHYAKLPIPYCIAPEWGIGLALLRATGNTDETMARRIESAFSELMNRFVPDAGEGKS